MSRDFSQPAARHTAVSGVLSPRMLPSGISPNKTLNKVGMMTSSSTRVDGYYITDLGIVVIERRERGGEE